MEKALFTLLRLGLGNSTPEKEDISEFIYFTKEQWKWLNETAIFYGVAGVALDGLKVIIDALGNDALNHFDDRTFWSKFILNWAIGTIEHGYEAQNIRQLTVIDTIQKLWAKEGIRMLLFKGQAMGTYYPEPKHRSPGDIDCYLFDDYAKGNEVAKTFADKVDERWYKHSVICYKGETIENHQYFVHTREGNKSKCLF